MAKNKEVLLETNAEHLLMHLTSWDNNNHDFENSQPNKFEKKKASMKRRRKRSRKEEDHIGNIISTNEKPKFKDLEIDFEPYRLNRSVVWF